MEDFFENSETLPVTMEKAFDLFEKEDSSLLRHMQEARKNLEKEAAIPPRFSAINEQIGAVNMNLIRSANIMSQITESQCALRDFLRAYFEIYAKTNFSVERISKITKAMTASSEEILLMMKNLDLEFGKTQVEYKSLTRMVKQIITQPESCDKSI
jgi:DNA repair ATPase RecN